MGRPRKTTTKKGDTPQVYDVECIEKTLRVSKIIDNQEFEVFLNLTDDGKVGLSNDNMEYATDYHFYANANKKTLERWENVLTTLLATIQIAKKEIK